MKTLTIGLTLVIAVWALADDAPAPEGMACRGTIVGEYHPGPNMAKFGGLPWDCILSAELMKHYKPDPETYLGAADLLGLRPDEVMMVAAHKGDLQSAQKVGFKAAFVTRPMEFGPERTVDTSPESDFDFNATDFEDLASKLGV